MAKSKYYFYRFSTDKYSSDVDVYFVMHVSSITNKSIASILKQCFWIRIKFITEDSNAIHTIITLDN
jgi:hypothetical protein